ncbi:cAMP-dependent protein kinase regulatory subunit [Venturia inaequalis]|nr:cAMP-dependent protein kinase regulatory subunit [Venturia inaequalis]
MTTGPRCRFDEQSSYQWEKPYLLSSDRWASQSPYAAAREASSVCIQTHVETEDDRIEKHKNMLPKYI